jgi:hypothetical protein
LANFWPKKIAWANFGLNFWLGQFWFKLLIGPIFDQKFWLGQVLAKNFWFGHFGQKKFFKRQCILNAIQMG